MESLPPTLRRLRLAVFATLAALALLAPSAAHARSDQLHGAQLHSLWSGSSVADFDRELDLVRDAGGDTVRLDLSWSSLETEGKGEFSDWYVNKADTFLEHARARGLKVIGTLWSTPCWAADAPDSVAQGCEGAWWDREVYRYAPRNPADYADAAAWVAERWGDDLVALEIWNEPNLPDQYSLRAADPARTYAGILKTAYPAVKRARPELTVVGGVLAFSDGDFLEDLYDHGISGHFDAISIHPYNEWRDPDDRWKPEWRKYTFLTGVPWVHNVMREHGDGDKDIWLTEFGFSTCGSGSSWCVSEAQQGEYIEDSFRIARGWSYVKAAIAYNLRNKGSNPTDREDQFGLVHRDFSPKAGYRGFAAGMAGYQGDAAAPQPPLTDGLGEIEILTPESVRVTTSGIAPVRVSCQAPEGASCDGTLTLTTRARRKRMQRGRPRIRRVPLGRRKFQARGGRSTTVHVRVPRRGRRLLRRLGRTRVRVTAVTTARAARRTSTFTVRYPRR